MWDLNSKATQGKFAELVGVSQQAISGRVRDGQLKRGGTLLQWVRDYCEVLRTEAAGRGGEDQAALTKARTQQASADARMKELQFFRELQLLVPVSDIEPLMASWASGARSEVQFAVEKLVSAIESKYGVDVDPQLIDDTVTPAYRAIADHGCQLADARAAGGGAVGPEAANTDQDLAG